MNIVYVCVYLYVHVQSVVEVTEPEKVCEAQWNVKGVELFVPQWELTQNVQVILVPPKQFQR